MDTMYWNLFWSTGMPEAWLMSRNGDGIQGPGAEPGGWEKLANSPLAAVQPRLNNFPGGPGGLY